MQTAKEEVIEVLSQLPNDVTLEEIQYRLYVRQKIQRGLKHAEEGKILTHEQVTTRMKKWIAR